ncbi:unnamed protein product [Phytophthora fragariaefolia]|uniref:Unnamed protein product n=1 Tax=Phytophthora fragariaefolia TaxID=1490495 RepID=A0A9W6Y5Y7_9STRA|nr:unnamed protein product [Phytophthora fragariaefolia]
MDVTKQTTTTVPPLIREAYADDDDLAGLVEALSVPDKTVELTAQQRSRLHRYSIIEGLLYYQVDGGDEPRIVVSNDEDLRPRVHYEAHDTPLSGHLGREKTYTSVARNFWWPRIYKWVCNSRPTRVATLAYWFLWAVSAKSTADHPQPDGQTQRVNRVLEHILRSGYAAEPTKWSTLLPQVELAINNAVNSSTGFTPFYVNGLRHPRTPLTLPPSSNLGGGEANTEVPRGLKGLRTPSKGICSRILRLARPSDSAGVTLWRLTKTLRTNRVITKGVRTRKCFNWETKSQ